ncbi:LLM class flavin-dependent oxidoreductase [Bordetella sp. 02P26C-1]|uniref:LLM class flavin-dependent oxidoreductase n=1 Tax=Bordetella sp. 02P26C-1 TaxID=2683195 RepID=UPI001355BCF0|nr:LLM class flavin-dependent oxidoreductase [Bordetella sp. 02P26C-1]MVW77834.1 LLM class flavin-dependent oxidoreductase [Bordetella sp. 02P26C-1]
MPIRVLGMIGVSPPAKQTVHIISGDLARDWIVKNAREHEMAGFDEVLIGYHSASAEGFSVAMYAGCHTERLSFLIAHRPGRILPALAARKIATVDRLLQGRVSMHIIIGGSDAEQHEEGDFTSKEERYLRGAEYLDIMRRIWTAPEPVDYEGRFYQVAGARSSVKPYQKPHPTLLFGGSSEGALAMGAQHCDVFAMFGEPLKETAERIADFRARCQVYGRTPGFNVSFRPIIADTEGEAWDKAKFFLEQTKNSVYLPNKEYVSGSQSHHRLAEIAAKGEVHDERLWMPIAAATGGYGNTTCLVGTPEQVAEAILKYYDLGVHSILIRGFEVERDVTEFGRELIPRLRQGALERDRAKSQLEPVI